MHLRRLSVLGTRGSKSERNAHRRHHTFEDVVVSARASALAAEIDDPDFVELLAHDFAHSRESRASEERGCRDHPNDCGTVMLLACLPDGPAPEVDVEVVEVLGVQAAPRSCERCGEGLDETGSSLLVLADHAAQLRSLFGSGGAQVGRIADHYGPRSVQPQVFSGGRFLRDRVS